MSLSTTSCLREKVLAHHLATAEDDYYPYYFLKGRSVEEPGPHAHLVDSYSAKSILDAVKSKTELIGPTFKHELTMYLLKRCPNLGLAVDADYEMKPWTTEEKIKDLRDICDVGIGFLFNGSHYVALLTTVFPNWNDFQTSELYSSRFLPLLQSLVKVMHLLPLAETTELKNQLIDVLAKFFLKGTTEHVSRSQWITQQLKK